MKLYTYQIIKHKNIKQEKNKPTIEEKYTVLHGLKPSIERTLLSAIFFMLLATVIMIIAGLDEELINDYYIFAVSTSIIIMLINSFTTTEVAKDLESEEEAKEYIKEYNKLRG